MAQQQSAQSQLSQLVQSVGSGLSTLGQIMSKVQGLPEGAAEKMQGIVSEYQSLIEELSGGGQEAPAQEAPAPGPASMEGGPRGMPASMAMKG